MRLNTRTRICLILQAYAEADQPPPTRRELATALGLTIGWRIQADLRWLRRKGYVDFEDGKQGTLRLLEPVGRVF